MHTKAKVAAAILTICASMSPVRAASSPMQPYVVQLPSHVLSLALPDSVARGKLPVRYEDTIDLQDPSFIRAGFYDVLEAMADFDGPFFWSEPYGSLKINVIVVKKSAAIDADIMTLDGLELFLRESKKVSAGAGEPPRTYSHVEINGMPAVLRTLNTFAVSGSDVPSDSEIYSIPLTPELFLNVNLTIKAWKEDRAKEPKWLPQALAMRDSIKATVRLSPKPIR